MYINSEHARVTQLEKELAGLAKFALYTDITVINPFNIDLDLQGR